MQILELFLKFNRRLESITARINPPLDVKMTHALIEVAQNPDCGVMLVSERLQIDKGNCSRLIKDAEASSYVKIVTDSNDARRKHLSLTQNGYKILHKDNIKRNQQISECIADLRTDSRDSFAKHLSLMADNLGAASSDLLDGEQPIRLQIRRLTRAMGMLGDNFMTSGVSLEHFQILAAVSTKPQGYLLSDLQQLLPYSQSNLSRFVTRLSAAGYLIKKVDRQDKRRAILKLSAKGKKIWESALSNALDRIGQGLKPLRSNIPKFQSELLQFLDDRI